MIRPKFVTPAHLKDRIGMVENLNTELKKQVLRLESDLETREEQAKTFDMVRNELNDQNMVLQKELEETRTSLNSITLEF